MDQIFQYSKLQAVFPLKPRLACRQIDLVMRRRRGRQIGDLASGVDTLGFGGFCTVDGEENYVHIVSQYWVFITHTVEL